MWQRMMTVSIAMALAGGALAQEQKGNEQAKPGAQNVAERQDRERLNAQVREAQAQEAEAQAALARDEAARAQVEHYRATAGLMQAQQRIAPPAAPRRWTALNTTLTRRENVTYCGISTAEPPPVLIEQLKLTRGIGLVVDYVEPGSPAATAGIKQYDVITKMNDQILSNAEQLGVLVRLRKPNDDANFTVIRQGQTSKIDVELGQKEMDVPVEAPAADPAAQNRAFWFGANGQLTPAPGALAAFTVDGGGGMAVTNIDGKIQSVWSDDQNSVNLQIKNGKATSMIVRDKAGKEIFNGPVETAQQRQALPGNLAQKLEKAEAALPQPTGAHQAAARNRVLTSTEGDTLLIARFEKEKAIYVFAFNTTDGKTLFEGPTTNDEQRKAVPQAVEKQLELLEKNQGAAPEFGVIGRN